MGHQETYRNNEEYSAFLDSWDTQFYQKYAETLAECARDGKALDVGCGVGQVLDRVRQTGVDVVGVDVSETNLKRARERHDQVLFYDGLRLPFKPESFDAVGALNVLEHVEEPESFIKEMIRVLRPGGRLVLSSPNFFRVLGLRDYHPRMRGVLRKLKNGGRLLAKWRQMRAAPEKVRFDRMEPIVREKFQPDDDAIVATNPLEMRFFLERNGCEIKRVECTDRIVHPAVDFLLNLTPTKYLMFNAFVVADKPRGQRPVG